MCGCARCSSPAYGLMIAPRMISTLPALFLRPAIRRLLPTAQGRKHVAGDYRASGGLSPFRKDDIMNRTASDEPLRAEAADRSIGPMGRYAWVLVTAVHSEKRRVGKGCVGGLDPGGVLMIN